MRVDIFPHLIGGLASGGPAYGRLGNPYQPDSLAQYQMARGLSADEIFEYQRNRAHLLANVYRRAPSPEELARQKAEAEYDGWLREWGMDEATSAP